MEEINVRYGQSLTINVSTDDTSSTQAVFYVGKKGETPKITITAPLTDGIGAFEFTTSDTKIPLGEYKYQINVEHSDGMLEKYPSPEDCPSYEDLPSFTIYEALDEDEVVS